MKESLDKPNTQAMTQILRKVKEAQSIKEYLIPIQTLFFGNFKDPKVAIRKEDFEKKVLCLESLGKMFKPDQ